MLNVSLVTTVGKSLFSSCVDTFEASDDESCGDVCSRDNDEYELLEVDLSQLSFFEIPSASCWLPGVFPSC